MPEQPAPVTPTTSPSAHAAVPADYTLAAIEASSGDAIIGKTLDGIVTSWNQAAERIYGHTAADVIGQHISVIVPVEQPDELPSIMERLRNGQRIDHYETVRVHKDGTRLDVSVSISPIYDDAERIVGAVSIGRDISTQRMRERERQELEERAQEAARQREAALRKTSATLEIINRVGQQLVAELDLDRLIEVVTDAATSLTGAQFGAFFYNALDERGEHYTLYAISGAPREAFSQFPLPRNTALFGPTFRGEETVRIADIRGDPRFGQNAPYYGMPQGHLPVISYLAVPVIGREGAVLGGLFFGHHEPNVFDERAAQLAEGLATQTAIAVENARLFQQVQRELSARRESEARYHTLVEQVPAVIYLLAADERGTGLYFSPYVTDLTGYTPEETMVRAETWLNWVHPDDRSRVAALEEETSTGAPFRAEYRHLRKDGSYVWVVDERVPVRDNAGAIAGWQGVMLDITPRVEAEEARARLAAIVDSAEDAIVSSDLQATITSWNRGAEKLYGYLAEEIVGQHMTVLLPDGRFHAPVTARIAAAQAGEPGEPFATVRRRKDGSLVDVTISLSPIRDHAGNVIGLSSITRDITAWKHAEAQLRGALDAAQAADATKSQFLAMMSHELRTPLQAILGYAELLLANPASNLISEEREDLGYIQQGGLRMLTLINQVLDISRLEAGGLEVILRPVDLPRILEQVRQDVAPQASQKGLQVRITLPTGLPPMVGDAEWLRRILLNLVGNAVKFTDHGLVTIEAEASEDIVVVTVADTGIGIPPEDLPQIFEAFRQTDTYLARRHGGAGLGLAIAQKLVALMDGQITVTSSPGAGSVFTLSVPAATLPTH